MNTKAAVTANAVILLDDYTEDNGATHVIPGSHKWTGDNRPHWFAEYSQAVPVRAKAGSLLIINGKLWHGSKANLSPQPRSALLLFYGSKFIRPQLPLPQIFPGAQNPMPPGNTTLT